MDGKSLGIVETLGLVPAVEAADTAAKSADVDLAGLHFAGAGLVSVVMAGDVSSVQASVDAAQTAAGRLGTVVSATVIARPAQGLDSLGPRAPNPEPGPGPDSEPDSGPGPGFAPEPDRPPPAGLEQMSVQALRRTARKFTGFSIPREKIKFARKKALIRAIRAHHNSQNKE